MTNFLLCPICKNPLQKSIGKNYTCTLDHNFDLAKEGYLNLLPVNKKNSKNPGDNNEMITARRSFLEIGYYEPLVKTISELIIENNPNDEIVLLDAGCGEGYYSGKILETTENIKSILGFDISKYAVKQAAKKYGQNFYFVGSVYDIPIKEKSVDILLSVFAPISIPAFYRVLKNSGQAFIVSSGPGHLRQLAEMVYKKFKPHLFNLPQKLGAQFEIINSKQTTFDIHLKNKKAILSLLKMTPYYWSMSRERQAAFELLNELEMTCDFRINVLEKITV